MALIVLVLTFLVASKIAFEFHTCNMYDMTDCRPLQCDGVSLDLANGPSLEGINLLNIPSMYGGSNLWGENPSQKKRKKAAKTAKKDKDREYSSSSMSSVDLSFAIQGKHCLDH